MIGTNWKKRALAAEKALLETTNAIRIAEEHITGIEARLADQAKLISIVRNGTKARFNFTRNGRLTSIELYVPMSIDLPALKRELLERGI